MLHAFITIFLLSASVIASANNDIPASLTPAQVAKLLDIDPSRVSTGSISLGSQRGGNIFWNANYNIAGGRGSSPTKDYSLMIALFPKGRIDTDSFEKASSENKSRKITLDDGGVVYCSFSNPHDRNSIFSAALANNEKDWDLTLVFSRSFGANDAKPPFETVEEGGKFVSRVEALLRKIKAEQD